jgi:hypothetical protein
MIQNCYNILIIKFSISQNGHIKIDDDVASHWFNILRIFENLFFLFLILYFDRVVFISGHLVHNKKIGGGF